MTIAGITRPARRSSGFTLIEQIMVLAIVAILTGAAAPSLQRLMSHNELQVAQTDVIGALQRARESAVISGKRSLFCPTRDGGNCSDDTRWEDGWLVGHDSDGDGQPDHQPMHVGPSHRGKLIIQSSNGRRIVHFRSDGTAGGSNLTLLFCQPAHPDDALLVMVSNAGRIRGARASAEQVGHCASLH